MSIDLMSAVWRDEYYAQGDKAKLLVALALADSANADGYAFPSVDFIAKKARTSVRGVQEVVRELVGDGKIQVQEGKGRNGTNLYRVLPPAAITPPAASAPGKNGNNSGYPRSQCTPAANAPRNEAAEKAAEKAPSDCTQSVRNHQEPSGNGNPPPPKANPQRMSFFPEGLRGKPFVQKFGEWEDHCRDRGKPLTSGSRMAALEKLKTVGEPRALEIVTNSLTSNWTTLVYDFEAKPGRPPEKKYEPNI